MKYIRARFKLTHPSAEPFDVYGWETEWMKKSQNIGDQIVEVGSIVSFQPITCMPDGKFIFPATRKNVEKAAVLKKLGQLTLAPGEKLETAQEVESQVVEEVWPTAPSATAEVEEAEFVAVEQAPAKPARKPRARQPEDLTPDVEA